jgi:adenosine deaminase
MNANYMAMAEALNLSKAELTAFAKISFQTSFLSEEDKGKRIRQVDEYHLANKD